MDMMRDSRGKRWRGHIVCVSEACVKSCMWSDSAAASLGSFRSRIANRPSSRTTERTAVYKKIWIQLYLLPNYQDHSNLLKRSACDTQQNKFKDNPAELPLRELTLFNPIRLLQKQNQTDVMTYYTCSSALCQNEMPKSGPVWILNYSTYSLKSIIGVKRKNANISINFSDCCAGARGVLKLEEVLLLGLTIWLRMHFLIEEELSDLMT